MVGVPWQGVHAVKRDLPGLVGVGRAVESGRKKTGAFGRPSMAVGQVADQHHQANTAKEPDNLRRCLAGLQAFLQLRNQVGQGHINKAAGSHHQEIGQIVLQLVHQPITEHAAQSGY